MSEVLYSYGSPLGNMLLAADEQGLTGAWFEGQKYERAGLSEGAVFAVSPVLEEAVEWLQCYFAGKIPASLPPLHLKGTVFRRRVWQKLLEIPYGTIVSYGRIAKDLESGIPGTRVSARAVGGAVGHNPVSLFVPCHRVCAADGGLTGYAGGCDRKEKLLQMEKRVLCGE